MAIKLFNIALVPIAQFDAMYQAADNGDTQAQRVAIAFRKWSDAMQANAHIGRPSCFKCSKIVAPICDGGEGIGGVAVIDPPDTENKESMVTVYCPKCERFGRKRLLAKLKKVIANEYDLIPGPTLH